VLQRRGNHDAFRVHHVDVLDRPDLAERFAVQTMPTLLVIEEKQVRARITAPRGSHEIESTLEQWLK
jgi:thioredoxin-like negative regulator of GroEL